MFISNRIPITRVKLFIARVLYLFLHLVLRKNIHVIRRKGIFYQVDLAEGIDLSLYLFGNFQSHVTNKKYFSLKEDAIVFDIGANIGSMVFQFAQMAPLGHIYAFEPTDYAFNKLLMNLALNPEIAKRITPVQLFLSDQTKTDHQTKAYSSWKVDGNASHSHPLHGGTIKPAESIPAVTLDDYCLENEIRRIDLIKIDTDGHELHVLNGAGKTVEKFLPYVIFEIGLYVLEEHNQEFKQYFSYFKSHNYDLFNIKNGKKINLHNFINQIPMRATTDIIAVPPKPSL